MAFIFDGRSFAAKKEEELKREITSLRKKGITPKLVSILVGHNPASILYVNLKKKAAERVGAKVEVKNWSQDEEKGEIIRFIKSIDKDKSVHGIMVQFPLPEAFSKKDRDEIINSITKEKDVDGLRSESFYLTPVVKAVIKIIREATQFLSTNGEVNVVVVGAKGFEGVKMVKVLKEIGYRVQGVDKKTKNLKDKTRDADILISATGSAGLIRKDMVKDGAVVIDVGAPKGDVRTVEIKEEASFISPVPGGVGPVTISCLLENLIEASHT